MEDFEDVDRRIETLHIQDDDSEQIRRRGPHSPRSPQTSPLNPDSQRPAFQSRAQDDDALWRQDLTNVYTMSPDPDDNDSNIESDDNTNTNTKINTNTPSQTNPQASSSSPIPILTHKNSLSKEQTILSRSRGGSESFSSPPNISVLQSTLSTTPATNINSPMTVNAASKTNTPTGSGTPSRNISARRQKETDESSIAIKMMESKGLMSGWVDYRKHQTAWGSAYFKIEESTGRMLFTPTQTGPFNVIVPDLREYDVKTITGESGLQIIELSLRKTDSDLDNVYIRPAPGDDYYSWLGALLCWLPFNQPGRENKSSASVTRTPKPSKAPPPPVLTRKKDSSSQNIIKAGRLMKWREQTITAKGKVAKERTWVTVSCILKIGGDFEIYSDGDGVQLHCIDLTSVLRVDIELIDNSLFGRNYCMGIKRPLLSQPSNVYSGSSELRTGASGHNGDILYFAADSRTTFETWFVLLRCVAAPELYGPPTGDANQGFRIRRTISVRLVDGKNIAKNLMTDDYLLPSDRERSVDSFCEVLLNREIRARSCVKRGTHKPFWREDFIFQDVPMNDRTLSVVVKLASKKGKDKYVGSVDINLQELKRDEYCEGWYPIISSSRDGTSIEKAGELFLRTRVEELAILMTHEYNELSVLLHDFENELTRDLAKFHPDLERVAENLLRIFQASGKATEWIMYVAHAEIEEGRIDPEGEQNDRKAKSAELNILFRGNTLLSKALDAHMRRISVDYLEETLGDILRKIAEENIFCEVDPMRIKHGEDLRFHWKTLLQLTRTVWKAISSSANKCPSDLRKIFQYIRKQVEFRYGQYVDVRYSCISGFIFLRFFCPALLNPRLFGLMRETPDPKAQRTLTLIAKSLQGLANMTRFGVKEPWMEHMNVFIDQNTGDFRKFIDTISSESTAIDRPPMTYSAMHTVTSRLAPLTKEGIPSVPYLIDQPCEFSALISLWLRWLMHQQEEGIVELTGILARFHDLCHDLNERLRQRISSAEIEDSQTSNTYRPIQAPAPTVSDHQELSAVARQGDFHEDPENEQRKYGFMGGLRRGLRGQGRQ